MNPAPHYVSLGPGLDSTEWPPHNVKLHPCSWVLHEAHGLPTPLVWGAALFLPCPNFVFCFSLFLTFDLAVSPASPSFLIPYLSPTCELVLGSKMEVSISRLHFQEAVV